MDTVTLRQRLSSFPWIALRLPRRLWRAAAAWIDHGSVRLRRSVGYETLATLGIFALLTTYLLLIFSAYLLRPGENDLLPGLLLLFFGGLVLGLALFLTDRTRLFFPQAVQGPLTPARLHRRRSALAVCYGVLLLWLAAEASAWALPGAPLRDMPHVLQVALLCAGTLLIVLGLGGAFRHPDNPRENSQNAVVQSSVTKRTRLRHRVVILLLLAGITALGFVLRAAGLGETVRQFVDELNFGSVVSYFWGDTSVPVLQPLVRGFTAFFSFFQALSVDLLGRDLVGLRGASVVFGTLTIPALWLLARELFVPVYPPVRPPNAAGSTASGTSRQGKAEGVALLGAFLLAVFPPHIHLSRLGMNNIADPLVGVLAFAFLTRGLLSQQRWAFALGGALLGFSQYFYEAGKLVFPPLALLWLGWLLVAWRRRVVIGVWRRQAVSWGGVGTALLAALLVAAPVYYVLTAQNLSLTPRFDDVGRLSLLERLTSDPEQLRLYLDRLGWAFRIYINAPEYGVLYYGGSTAMLLPPLVPLFFAGLWLVLWHPRQPALLLPLWLLVTSLGNSLLTEPRLFTRFVLVFPVVMLLTAAGLRYGVALLLPPRVFMPGQERLLRRMAWVGVPALLAVFAVLHLDYYYGAHLAMFNHQIRSYWAYDGQDALLRSAQFPPGTRVHIFVANTIDTNYARGILGFLADGLEVQVYAPDVLPVSVVANLPRVMDHAFFIAPDDARTLNLIQQFFVLSGPAFSPYDIPVDKQLVLYYAPAALNQLPLDVLRLGAVG